MAFQPLHQTCQLSDQRLRRGVDDPPGEASSSERVWDVRRLSATSSLPSKSSLRASSVSCFDNP